MLLGKSVKTLGNIFFYFIVLVAIIGSIYLSFNMIGVAIIHQNKEFKVPNLFGKTLEEAVTIVSDFGCGIAKFDDVFDVSKPVGTVTAQNPFPNTVVREGKIIYLTLSKGGQIVRVPDLIGDTQEVVELKLDNATLSLGEITREYSIAYKEDTVIKQIPDATELMVKNSMVHVVFSKGYPKDGKNRVPEFRFSASQYDVEQWMNTWSIDTENVIFTEKINHDYPAGTVLEQSLQPDTIFDAKDSTIEVSVAVDFTFFIYFPSSYYYDTEEQIKDYKVIISRWKGHQEILFEGKMKEEYVVDLPPWSADRVKIFVYSNEEIVEEKTFYYFRP